MIEIKIKFDNDEPVNGLHSDTTIRADSYAEAREHFLLVLAGLDEEHEHSPAP